MNRDEDNLWGLILTAIDIGQDVVHYVMKADLDSLDVMQSFGGQESLGLQINQHTCYIDNVDYIRLGNIVEWARRVEEIQEKERKTKERQRKRDKALREQHLRHCRGY